MACALACTNGVTDQQEISSTSAPVVFSGYTLAPSVPVSVRVRNQATGAFVTVASTVSGAAVSVPANSLWNNPPLYAWSASASVANPCFYNPQCVLPTGSYGVSTLTTRAVDGDGSDLIVFTPTWSVCMGERVAAGATFLSAAYECRSPSYPDLRLRFVGEWWPLPALPTSSPPALAGIRSSLAIAASTGATVQVATVPRMGAPLAWAALAGAPSAGMATDVAPAFATDRDESMRRLIARGNDGRIYHSDGAGPLAPLPTGAGATGRLSLALSNPVTLHLTHGGSGGTFSYWRLDGSNPVTAAATRVVLTGLDGTVGALDADRALVAARTGNAVTLLALPRGATSPTLVGTLSAGVRVEDVSEVVVYGGRYHVLVAKVDSGSAVQLVHVTSTGVAGSMTTEVIATIPAGPTPTGVALALLRSRGVQNAVGGNVAIVHGHLVAAWRDTGPGIRTARWERTDATARWRMESPVGATSTVTGRPAVAGAYMARYLDAGNNSGFGNDLFVAASEAPGRVRFANLTRGMMRRYVEQVFELFDHDVALCSKDTTLRPRWLPDLAQADRQIVSELGALLWTLPIWFTDELFREDAVTACRRGERQPEITATGRACELDKKPVVVKPVSTIFVCPDGMYMNHDSSVTALWDEGGHVVASMLGWHDDGIRRPTARDAEVTDIALPTLQAGYDLFGTRPTNCGDNPRCPGFVVWYDSFGSPTRQHAFIEAMGAYMFAGATLRRLIAEDVARPACHDLLARKYLWIRTNLFHGQEFDDRGEPIAPTLVPTCSGAGLITQRGPVSAERADATAGLGARE